MADTIDQVIRRLGEIVDRAKVENSRAGYFAALYLRVTDTIRQKLGTGYFDDDARMERLDVAFAGRYLQACDQYRNQQPLPKGWAVAFGALGDDSLLVVQQLLLAMNPHINIDLGSAAAEVAPGSAIGALKGDFMKINDVLATIVPTVIQEIGEISPLIHLLNDVAEDEEQAVINFSMRKARDFAWDLAQLLAPLDQPARQEVVDNANVFVAALSNKIIDPGELLESVLHVIRAVESKSVVANIGVLNSGNPMPEMQSLLEMAASWSGEGTPPNKVYYFEVADGTWTGSFTFKVTSWGNLWRAQIGLKNKFLVVSMVLFQKVFGDGSISSVITAYPERGVAGVAHNKFLIKKGFFQLFRSDEDYTLAANGSGVEVDAHVRFGPIPFLFGEHDVYPASIYDGGMRALYLIRLLGTRFTGDYTVREDRKQVHSVLFNDFATADETLNKT